MNKPISDFVELADNTVFNENRIKNYYNAILTSSENDKISTEKLVAALAVEIRRDILSTIVAYHDWTNTLD